MEHASELYRDWLGAFAAIGTPAIGRDTAARILAVTYVHGNNEALVYNSKYLQDKAPEWAHKLFKDKYGIKLIN